MKEPKLGVNVKMPFTSTEKISQIGWGSNCWERLDIP